MSDTFQSDRSARLVLAYRRHRGTEWTILCRTGRRRPDKISSRRAGLTRDRRPPGHLSECISRMRTPFARPSSPGRAKKELLCASVPLWSGLVSVEISCDRPGLRPFQVGGCHGAANRRCRKCLHKARFRRRLSKPPDPLLHLCPARRGRHRVPPLFPLIFIYQDRSKMLQPKFNTPEKIKCKINKLGLKGSASGTTSYFLSNNHFAHPPGRSRHPEHVIEFFKM